MIFTLFLCSLALFVCCAAYDTHIKYFHEGDEGVSWSDLSFSFRRLGVFNRNRPDWILYHPHLYWQRLASESLLFFLAPFVLSTGFYAGLQFYLNVLVDNFDQQEMTIRQLHNTIEMIKARVQPYLFLQNGLLPLGIATVVLSAAFPFLRKVKVNQRLSRFRAGLFRFWYFATVFSMFTFFGGTEVLRQNQEIAGLAARINRTNATAKNIHRSIKRIAAKQIARKIAASPELNRDFNAMQSLQDKLRKKRVPADDKERQKAAEAYNAAVAGLSNAKFWERLQDQVFTIPDYKPDTDDPAEEWANDPEDPNPPENPGGGGAQPDPTGSNRPMEKTGGAPSGKNKIRDPASIEPPVSNPSPDPKPKIKPSKEEAAPKKVVSDERKITFARHDTYQIPDADSPEWDWTDGKAASVDQELTDLEKKLDIESAGHTVPNPVLKVAAQKIANAFVAGAYSALKEAVNPSHLLAAITDALYAKAVMPRWSAFVEGVLANNLPKARSSLEEAERAMRESLTTTQNEAEAVQKLRQEMERVQRGVRKAETEYAVAMNEIRKQEEALKAKALAQTKARENAEEAKLEAANAELRQRIAQKINQLTFNVNSTDELVNKLRLSDPDLSNNDINRFMSRFNSRYTIGKNIDYDIVQDQKREYIKMLTTCDGAYDPQRLNALMKSNLQTLSEVNTSRELIDGINSDRFNISRGVPICSRCGLPITFPVCPARF